MLNPFDVMKIGNESHALKEFVLVPVNVLAMVRASTLNLQDAMLLALIDGFSQRGMCYASNRYFADFFGCSMSVIERTVTKLTQLGLIVTDTSRGKRFRTISIVPENYYPVTKPTSKKKTGK